MDAPIGLLWLNCMALFSHNAYGLAKTKQKVILKKSNFCLKIVAAENEWWGGTL